MNNIQDFIASSDMFRKFQLDDLLFVEFKCPIEEAKSSIWCNNNFFAYILTGETKIKTLKKDYPLKPGDCVFAKKGSLLIESEFQEDFCELMVFVPDDFIRSVIHKYQIPLITNTTDTSCDAIFPMLADELLMPYFNSLLSYFNQPAPPSETLLRLKFEELIVSMLSINKYFLIKCYFSEIARSSKPSIAEIMETNFTSKLSIPEMARLCARSLSSFKSEFHNIYHTTPGKWLLEKRLEYGRYLIESTDDSIDEICFKSGYENISHFIRVFKNKYGSPPGKYKMQKKSLLSSKTR
jgi:AraC-like DNA-binding protein